LYSVVITWCAADGMPVGLLVNLPLKKIEFSPEEWVGVEGIIQFMPCDQSLKNIDSITAIVSPEKRYPVFTATNVYRVQPPWDEYLFPEDNLVNG
jgi:uncharacterized membrane protein YcgQ (UPF0703/DUF1980 family)